MVKAGQSIQAGRVVGAIIPGATEGDGWNLQASLFVPSRVLGFIKTGQTVWIKYGAYAHQKFGMGKGTVNKISPTPIYPDEFSKWQESALQPAMRSKDPIYRIDVSLLSQTIEAYGETLLLRPGMSVEAEIMQESRTILEWIFEPIFNASNAMNGMSIKK